VGPNLPVFFKGVNNEYIPKRTIQAHAAGLAKRYVVELIGLGQFAKSMNPKIAGAITLQREPIA